MIRVTWSRNKSRFLLFSIVENDAGMMRANWVSFFKKEVEKLDGVRRSHENYLSWREFLGAQLSDISVLI